MAEIPPVKGAPQPTPPPHEGPFGRKARELGKTTKAFADQLNAILESPHLADNRENLGALQHTILALHDQTSNLGKG